MEAVVMRVRYRDSDIPYPLSVIKGRLKLCGLSEKQVYEVMDKSLRNLKNPTEEDLLTSVRKSIESDIPTVITDFETLTRYDELRSKSEEVPPIVVVLLGASASGKSIIGLEIIHSLVATRFISSDTVRQVLRSIMNKEEHPELYCHTYQAHLHRQTGPKDLDPVIRGFLSQCDIITPHIIRLTDRIISEGATGVVEGVHMLPGMLKDRSPGIIEILIHPDDETHRSMFTNKHAATKLRTVSKDIRTREKEYEGSRAIQEYMVKLAQDKKIPIVEMTDFESATISAYTIIVESVAKLVLKLEGVPGQ